MEQKAMNNELEQYTQARELINQEKYTEALPLFLNVLEQKPQNNDAKKYEAICYLYTDRHEQALIFFNDFAQSTETDYRFINYAATVFAYYDRIHKAESIFSKHYN